jgi:D-alanyl-lipoteichoic acid acyltransferase DltB (MBOAT superfamily)
MLFNSIEFALFLPIVFLIYWRILGKNIKVQNGFLLLASYFFYGWWDWRFLILLISISLFNYLVGIKIDASRGGKPAKRWLTAGLVVNIGILGVFKYFNFFIDGFIDLISLVGYELPRFSTSIILPLGISFYVFLSLSYILDVYKENLTAGKSIVEVLLSLSFFPIILAGPIQRPSTLLPQIRQVRKFSYEKAADGLRQILWGLFAKVVIADELAPLADEIFQDYLSYSGSTLLIGAIFFSVQIYADFSGYSNMAIGIAKLLGFNLMRNFDNPYFSRDITEFWKKWHISLTTWFRDYLFLPFSFSLSGKFRTERVFYIKTDYFIYVVASSVTWLLTGLWHGANYTFIIWGLINGVLLIIYHLQRKPRKKLFKKTGINNNNKVIIMVETIITLTIVLLAWIFFKAENMNHALLYIERMISPALLTFPEVFPKKTILLVLLFFIAEWFMRNKEHALQLEKIKIGVSRWAFYFVIIFLILYYRGNQQQFIYFQF